MAPADCSGSAARPCSKPIGTSALPRPPLLLNPNRSASAGAKRSASGNLPAAMVHGEEQAGGAKAEKGERFGLKLGKRFGLPNQS